MKKILASLLICLAAYPTFAQTNIGIGTTTPHASAALDVSSTTRGLLAPRMTTAQRNAIASPAKGLLVYDTNLNGLYHYNGSTWASVGGSGGFTLPYSGSTSIAGDAFSITHNGAGSAIIGNTSSNTVAAIEGNSMASVGGYGVFGTSTSPTGFGVAGNNATGTAVFGFSPGTGTALRGSSTNGYGLFTTGNLRMMGGNTNPTAGAVLTSVDGNGNAVWKDNRIAFSASEALNAIFAHGTNVKVEFKNLHYNYGDAYLLRTNTTTPNTSAFTAPVTGVYHFDAALYGTISDANFISTFLSIFKNGTEVAVTDAVQKENFFFSSVYLNISLDIKLIAGDKIWVVFHQTNDEDVNSAGAGANDRPHDTRFSGHLVFAE